MNEFSLIRRYFQRPAQQPSVQLGIGDDAAILTPTAGHDWLWCSDTLVSGRHFAEDAAAYDIGWKSLAVNLSDLAAMGAKAVAFLLNLSLPQADEDFLQAFAQGLFDLAQQHGIDLIGGDTTRGPLNIGISALGEVPSGQALRRDGAQVGDRIYLGGPIGNAALALHDAHAPAFAQQALNRPQPQLDLGLALRGQASACIDISDGLAGDLGHILQASGVGAELNLADLPMPDWAAPEQALQAALYGGDDYALCITAPQPPLLNEECSAQIHCIGQITEAPGLRLRRDAHTLEELVPKAYSHF